MPANPNPSPPSSSRHSHHRHHTRPPHTWQPKSFPPPSSSADSAPTATTAAQAATKKSPTHRTRSLTLAIGIACIAVFGALTGASLKEWYQQTRSLPQSALTERIVGSDESEKSKGKDNRGYAGRKEGEGEEVDGRIRSAAITAAAAAETSTGKETSVEQTKLKQQQLTIADRKEVERRIMGLEGRRATLVQQRGMLQGKIEALKEREAAEKERSSRRREDRMQR